MLLSFTLHIGSIVYYRKASLGYCPHCIPDNNRLCWFYPFGYRLFRFHPLVTHPLIRIDMRKRNNKTAAQQCRYYEVDDIFGYMVETYINGNISVFRELYTELNKDARKDFIDFVFKEVKSQYRIEIIKKTI